jgi:alanine dehydrogenase
MHTIAREVAALRVLSRSDVERLLDLRACIEAVATAHAAFSQGRAIMPVRLHTRFHDVGSHNAMPAWLDDGPALGLKSITKFPRNADRGLAPILAVFLLLDPESGRTLAVMDAVHLTEVRTAAASAVATRALSRPESATLALVGAGVQARSHLAAMKAVRPIDRVRVAASRRESAERFVAEQARLHPELDLAAVDTGAEAAAGADVVCTVSSSPTPVLTAAAVARGTHVNAVGSHTPAAREIDGGLMSVARVVVDSRAANLSESGDCLIPIAEGLFGPEHVSDELGEVLTGAKPGRRSDDEITIYQSCGIAVQDVAAAKLVYDRALAEGVGTVVEL